MSEVSGRGSLLRRWGVLVLAVLVGVGVAAVVVSLLGYPEIAPAAAVAAGVGALVTWVVVQRMARNRH